MVDEEVKSEPRDMKVDRAGWVGVERGVRLGNGIGSVANPHDDWV